MTLVIILAIALVLFGLSFITKRRFGVLGLGLAAGALLAQSWSSDLAQILAVRQISFEPLSPSVTATVALTVIPALLLLIAGPKYADKRYAFIGSICFAILGTLLLLGPLTIDLLPLSGDMKSVLDFLAEWQDLLIAGGIVLAIVDMLHANGSKSHSKKSGKH